MTLPARAEASATTAFSSEKGPPPDRGYEFRAALRGAVRIAAVHRLVLAIGPEPLGVLVTFAAGDVADHPHAVCATHRIEQVHQTHDVDGLGFHRIAVGRPHQGPGGHVDDNFPAAQRRQTGRNRPRSAEFRNCVLVPAERAPHHRTQTGHLTSPRRAELAGARAPVR
jgi:hypothetical protein